MITSVKWFDWSVIRSVAFVLFCTVVGAALCMAGPGEQATTMPARLNSQAPIDVLSLFSIYVAIQTAPKDSSGIDIQGSRLRKNETGEWVGASISYTVERKGLRVVSTSTGLRCVVDFSTLLKQADSQNIRELQYIRLQGDNSPRIVFNWGDKGFSIQQAEGKRSVGDHIEVVFTIEKQDGKQ